MRTLMLSSVVAATALMSVSPAAVAQERAFCLRDAGGALLCNYDTMVLCEQGLAGRAGGCVANPRLGTTGGPPAMGRERGKLGSARGLTGPARGRAEHRTDAAALESAPKMTKAPPAQEGPFGCMAGGKAVCSPRHQRE